jgi:outer membrane protein assembly factor BamB
MPSAVHAPPVVMAGLVYVATCATCGSEASRFVKMGTDSTTAFDARTGKQAWRFPGGKYASPITADQERVYLTGRSFLYALESKRAKQGEGAGKRGAAGSRSRR